MTAPVPPEAVEAAMKASRSHVRRDDGARGTCIECGLTFTDWPSWQDHVIEAIAAAVVAALGHPDDQAALARAWAEGKTAGLEQAADHVRTGRPNIRTNPYREAGDHA